MPQKPSRQILYIASRNDGKFAEFRGLISDGRWILQSLNTFGSELNWEENGRTFYENARIKAHAVRARTGEAVLADDSGLVVPGLRGAPGVMSRRYAGPEGDDEANNAKLMLAIKDVPADQRQCEFVCCLVFIDSAGHEFRFTGSCKGTILAEPRGAQGFGYDPLFLVEGTTKTMAELPMDEKNKLSHRARAVQAWSTRFG